MSDLSSFEHQFQPGAIRAIDTRLNDVEFACGLLKRAEELRTSKVPVIAYSSMTPEQQAAACMTGNYLGGTDVFGLAWNGIKEYRARKNEYKAYDILDNDTY